MYLIYSQHVCSQVHEYCIFKPGSGWFFLKVSMHVCMFAPRLLLITSGMIWSPYHWLNKFYTFIWQLQMVSLVDVALELNHVIKHNRVSQHYIRHYFHFKSHLKQLYISNKTECFNYKGGYGICEHMHIKIFKRAGLGYR